MRSRDVIKKLRADQVASKGSHHQFKHETRKGRVTVPHPNSDLAVGTLRSIERQSGVKLLQ